MSIRKKKYTAKEILTIQIQYLSKVLVSMRKIDWANQDPAKIALEFPEYMTNVLERFIDLSVALLDFIPNDTKSKNTDKTN